MAAHDPALQRLVERVRAAASDGTALELRGGGTKRFYGGSPRGAVLDVHEVRGISSYEPSELVVTVRAGTPLAELEAALAEHGQCLAFEPPRFAPGGTVGGMVAAGLAGPARASVGGVRDFLLGASVLDGRGEVLTFGGQVMKNVAGYDVARLMAGALGVLGVVCEVSLKVLPVAPGSATLEFERGEAEALAWLNALAAQPLPLNASSWYRGRLRLRLRGAVAAVRTACARLGGREAGADDAAWEAVRDHRHDFFCAGTPAEQPLWRLSVPDTAAPLALPGEQFIEWGGALRWWRTAAPAAEVHARAAAAGGHATLFRAEDKPAAAFAPLAPASLRIQQRLKCAFDPAGIFNPGRLHPDL